MPGATAVTIVAKGEVESEGGLTVAIAVLEETKRICDMAAPPNPEVTLPVTISVSPGDRLSTCGSVVIGPGVGVGDGPGVGGGAQPEDVQLPDPAGQPLSHSKPRAEQVPQAPQPGGVGSGGVGVGVAVTRGNSQQTSPKSHVSRP